MPVKKKTTAKKQLEKTIVIAEKESSVWLISDHAKKLIWTLLGIFLVYSIIWLATLIRNNLQEYYYINQVNGVSRTIVVTESSEVSTKPDIALTTIGMISSGETVKEAQDANTTVMNNIIAGLKALGIEETDIQTAQYNVYPKYTYTSNEGRVEDGYEVSQNVKIKIRNLSKANSVISLAGEYGANTVGGLQFSIDDPAAAKQDAREAALKKVKLKALKLANSLGVDIVGVVSYNEYEGGNNRPAYYKEAVNFDIGYGGSAPDIQPGESNIIMTVSVTYEIR